ncbi:MAG: roadblock/LC7 domain-containing protein [Pseudomonadota bacterium]
MTSISIPPEVRSVAEAVIEKLRDEVRGIKAVLVSTEDGFELASRVENTAQVDRLSAMASSLVVLGALAGEESSLGQCDSVTIEATSGYIIMLQVRHHSMGLILSVITSREVVLGQVLYFSKQAAAELQRA